MTTATNGIKFNSTRTMTQTAAVACVEESLELPTTLFGSLEELLEAAKGGYSILTPLILNPLYGMGVVVFDRAPYAGREEEDGNWVYTEVGVYPL